MRILINQPLILSKFLRFRCQTVFLVFVRLLYIFLHSLIIYSFWFISSISSRLTSLVIFRTSFTQFNSTILLYYLSQLFSHSFSRLLISNSSFLNIYSCYLYILSVKSQSQSFSQKDFTKIDISSTVWFGISCNCINFYSLSDVSSIQLLIRDIFL